MCSKIVSNTLIYLPVALQQFCRVTGTSGNSGQEKFRTAWGTVILDIKLKLQVLCCITYRYVIVDYYFKNQIIVWSF